ncbi:MAG: prenyltransferase/squalene oxidase repeat-containing protein [Planctomycetota bacterium]
MTQLNDDPNRTDINDADNPASEPSQDFFETLGESLGTLPWWAMSIGFHVVILLMLALIGLTQMQETDPDAMRIIMEPEPEIIYDNPQLPEAIAPVITEIEIETEEVLVQIDPVDITDTIETENEVDSETAKGDEKNFTNVDSNSNFSDAAMGFGSGLSGQKGNGLGGRIAAFKHIPGSGVPIKVVDDALDWLARHQEPDGHWDNIKYGGNAEKHDPAQTGLALMAFLASGHSEKAGIYKDNVVRAVKWLRDHQQPNGAFADGWGYNHAICALAMTEAADMANVKETKQSAQKAVDYSVNIHQIGEGSNKSGWRYAPKAAAADISVSGWFIMQLKSAKVAKLKVPFDAFEGAEAFLKSVEVNENKDDPYGGHRYAYMADPDNDSQKIATGMRTAIGIMSRQFMGTPRDELQGGVQFMLQQKGVPSWGAGGDAVDWYYWYYASMVTYQMGNDFFKQWSDAMLSALGEHQIHGGDNGGSWDPTGRYASEGRVFSTSMGALCMSVWWRKATLYR